MNAPNLGGDRVSRLPLMILAAVAAMAALVTMALAANGDPTSYADGTPEAVLQQFVSAAFENDQDAMLDQLTENMRARCMVEFDDDVYGRMWSASNMRAELESIETDGDTARITVKFREGSDDPFSDSSWDYERIYTLKRVDSIWRIERAGWPYPFEDCTRGGNG